MAKRSTVKLEGLETFSAKLGRCGAAAEGIAKQALYEGAEVVADALRTATEALPAMDDNYNLRAYAKGEKNRLTKAQKEGLLDGLGVSTMQTASGIVNVSVGFDGYNSVKTKTYPKGQPNTLIARVVESGSSYMDKTPFIRKTVNKVKNQANKAMQEVADEAFKKIMEG